MITTTICEQATKTAQTDLLLSLREKIFDMKEFSREKIHCLLGGMPLYFISNVELY